MIVLENDEETLVTVQITAPPQGCYRYNLPFSIHHAIELQECLRRFEI
jgi:hypothetical protein